jgi:prepilin-type processing-associated H-X9-DG protein
MSEKALGTSPSMPNLNDCLEKLNHLRRQSTPHNRAASVLFVDGLLKLP